MGNPSGPPGHLPYKAEEFCFRTDKLFAAMDFKSGAAYQRGSMKPFFPTEFRLRRFIAVFVLKMNFSLTRKVCLITS